MEARSFKLFYAFVASKFGEAQKKRLKAIVEKKDVGTRQVDYTVES